MKCWKCGKEMDRDLSINEEGSNFHGCDVRLHLESEEMRTPEQIAYNNIQLGKYSDGKGECHVAICYECYIDGQFNLK